MSDTRTVRPSPVLQHLLPSVDPMMEADAAVYAVAGQVVGAAYARHNTRRKLDVLSSQNAPFSERLERSVPSCDL